MGHFNVLDNVFDTMLVQRTASIDTIIIFFLNIMKNGNNF